MGACPVVCHDSEMVHVTVWEKLDKSKAEVVRADWAPRQMGVVRSFSSMSRVFLMDKVPGYDTRKGLQAGGFLMNKEAVAKELVAVAKMVAMDFPTQKALDQYLKDHLDADKSNHHVKEIKKDFPSEKGESLTPRMKQVEIFFNDFVDKKKKEWKTKEQFEGDVDAWATQRVKEVTKDPFERAQKSNALRDYLIKKYRGKALGGHGMNKEAVARELLAVAKDLTAGGWDRFSEDLSDILEAQIMMNKRKSEMDIFNIIKAKMRSDKDLVDMMRKERMSDRDLLGMIRSNLEFMV